MRSAVAATRGRALVLLVLLGLVAACATNPVTGRRELSFMSEAQEIAIAQESDPQIKQEMGVYNDPELQAYVDDIGQRMARISERPQLPWRFTVVDVPAVNAFAVPGGGIYITRGILPFLDSEAELAGVIGHEIGHVTARHSAQQYTQQVSGQVGLLALGIFVPQARPFGELSSQALGVLFMKYGRDDELQADRLGARYEATLGWDPAAAPAFLSTLGRLAEAAGDRRGVPNWMSTHPEPLSRVEDIQPTVAELKASGATYVTNRDAWIRRVDGIIFGDNPDQGLARGRTFVHPVLRFQLDFPNQWEIANSPQQVVAQAPGNDAIMLLRGVAEPQGQSMREIALNSMRSAGLRATAGEVATIGGLDAYLGVYQGQIEGLGAVTMRAGHIRHDREVYLVAGLTPPDAFRQSDATFLASIRSFRQMSAAEAEAIRPNRVDLYVVRSGDTWQGIAERSGGVVTPSTLAIMNQSTLGTQPRVGLRIKIVVSG
ncbi:MAG: M48 family metalloprotease [Acidobacteria bacterium]|nr:M48 family metalloprotease [Acidobacteriota bacterium]